MALRRLPKMAGFLSTVPRFRPLNSDGEGNTPPLIVEYFVSKVTLHPTLLDPVIICVMISIFTCGVTICMIHLEFVSCYEIHVFLLFLILPLYKLTISFILVQMSIQFCYNWIYGHITEIPFAFLLRFIWVDRAQKKNKCLRESSKVRVKKII